MRQLLAVLITNFLIAGCVASDPAKNIIYEQELVGEWNQENLFARGQYLAMPPNYSAKIIFRDDKTWDVSLIRTPFEKAVALIALQAAPGYKESLFMPLLKVMES